MNGDCISRSALKETLRSYPQTDDMRTTELLGFFERLIDEAPTVETEVITLRPMTDEMTQDLIDKINTNVGMAQAISEERPQGEWIDTGSGQECSLCKEIQYGYDNFRYFCPYCGAKMKGGAE
jgi:hypothetical protein